MTMDGWVHVRFRRMLCGPQIAVCKEHPKYKGCELTPVFSDSSVSVS